MGWRNRYDRYRSDPLVRLIGFAALVGLGVLIVTNFWPGIASGVGCADLPQPQITGSNQSILASNVDASALRLELIPITRIIARGQALSLELRFINDSVAPLTLLMIPEEVLFRYTGQEAGIAFAVQELTGRVIGEPFTSRAQVPVRNTFEPRMLRILGPRSRCNLRVDVSPQRLEATGMIQGDYRIIGVYRNPSRGVLPAPGPNTPTPVFRDQGVLIGEVRSNDVIVSVGVAPVQ